MSVTRGLMDSCRFSTQKMMKPPTTRAMATGTGPNRCALMALLNSTPKTAAGRKPMMTLSAKRCWTRSVNRPASTLPMRTR